MRGWKFTDNLYVMGTPRVEDVLALGATAILNVAKKVTPPEVVAMVKHSHYAIQDGKRVDTLRFDMAAQLVETWLTNGERVIVHCLAGRNRSVMVAVLALKRLGVVGSGEEALTLAREVRPRSLWNPVFEAYLRELA